MHVVSYLITKKKILNIKKKKQNLNDKLSKFGKIFEYSYQPEPLPQIKIYIISKAKLQLSQTLKQRQSTVEGN
jgi:hypothetical protein